MIFSLVAIVATNGKEKGEIIEFFDKKFKELIRLYV